jgi:bifunctional UDP-N-acetylglucosamine pyrophosphorylase/glucosamine-1-phosphate N-acetyltransferase
VTVGEGAIVGAGSTITRDVAADAVVVARGEQKESAGAAPRLRESRRARKARGETGNSKD